MKTFKNLCIWLLLSDASVYKSSFIPGVQNTRDTVQVHTSFCCTVYQIKET